VFIRIRGVLHYLWRAVDQHGIVPDILVQERRDGTAAKRFSKRLLHGLKYQPRRLVTDGLRSYFNIPIIGAIKWKERPACSLKALLYIYDHGKGSWHGFTILSGIYYRNIKYGVACRTLLLGVRRRTSRYLNNRAENSHRPMKRRERQMQRFKSPARAQAFLSSYGIIYGHFRPRRPLLSATRLSAGTDEGLPALATGDLRPSSDVRLTARPPSV
jgi:putative transposase